MWSASNLRSSSRSQSNRRNSRSLPESSTATACSGRTEPMSSSTAEKRHAAASANSVSRSSARKRRPRSAVCSNSSYMLRMIPRACPSRNQGHGEVERGSQPGWEAVSIVALNVGLIVMAVNRRADVFLNCRDRDDVLVQDELEFLDGVVVARVGGSDEKILPLQTQGE